VQRPSKSTSKKSLRELRGSTQFVWGRRVCCEVHNVSIATFVALSLCTWLLLRCLARTPAHLPHAPMYIGRLRTVLRALQGLLAARSRGNQEGAVCGYHKTAVVRHHEGGGFFSNVPIVFACGWAGTRGFISCEVLTCKLDWSRSTQAPRSITNASRTASK